MIELSDLQFRWPGARQILLKIPRLSVDKSERVFLYGPSGCGKTTLLNLLGGVVVPEKGDIHIAGTRLNMLSGAARDRFRADHVGFIFQLFNLVPYLGLIENVVLPCTFSARRREAAIASAGSPIQAARQLLTRMHLDVEDLANQPVAQLSVGQQQRVAAARALIGAPSLVIADEPTSSIDAAARDAFLDLLFQEVATSDATLLFVSHDADLQSKFSRSIQLPVVNQADAQFAA